jgi:hypothetical protein
VGGTERVVWSLCMGGGGGFRVFGGLLQNF